MIYPCAGEGNGSPLQYSCLENTMDRGAWRATVHKVTKSWTWLSDWACKPCWNFRSLILKVSVKKKKIKKWEQHQTAAPWMSEGNEVPSVPREMLFKLELSIQQGRLMKLPYLQGLKKISLTHHLSSEATGRWILLKWGNKWRKREKWGSRRKIWNIQIKQRKPPLWLTSSLESPQTFKFEAKLIGFP